MTPQAEISIQDQDLAALATSPPFASEEGQPVDHISIRETGQWFRRTYVRRGRTSVRNIGLMMAALAAEVANPALPVYPNPAPDNCSTCVFRAPCIALSEGADPTPILEASFRRRTGEEGEEGDRTASTERHDDPQRIRRMVPLSSGRAPGDGFRPEGAEQHSPGHRPGSAAAHQRPRPERAQHVVPFQGEHR